MIINIEESKMKVFVAFKFKPHYPREFIGFANSREKAMKILKDEYPCMQYDNGTMVSDKNQTYILDIVECELILRNN